MTDEEIFSEVGFEKSLSIIFHTLQEFLESVDGCNAKVYKPAAMREARAALIGPGEKHKKAQHVFLRIYPERRALRLWRRWGGSRQKEQTEVRLSPDFSDWEPLKKMLKEWSLDPKLPRPPKAAYEFGDGVALPGGLPETNHAKF